MNFTKFFDFFPFFSILSLSCASTSGSIDNAFHDFFASDVINPSIHPYSKLANNDSLMLFVSYHQHGHVFSLPCCDKNRPERYSGDSQKHDDSKFCA